MILGLFVGLLLLVSLVFNCLGVISLYRFPDMYTRLHGATKCTTFGTLFAIFALVVYSLVRWFLESDGRFGVLFVHILIAGAVFMISNPAGAHALARAAHRSGIFPNPSVVDALEETEKQKKGGMAA